jgi:hypothetical protein
MCGFGIPVAEFNEFNRNKRKCPGNLIIEKAKWLIHRCNFSSLSKWPKEGHIPAIGYIQPEVAG